MKRQTAKPDEAGMQFFTPDLYLRFNSSDDAEADRAETEWDDAIARYRDHLLKIHSKLPPSGRELCETCLHDAELLACDVLPQASNRRRGIAALTFQLEDRLHSLFYLLWDELCEHPAPRDWPFSEKRRHLLYDEVDIAPGSRVRFLHRVLLSDGVVIEIPFVAVLLHSFRLHMATGHEVSRQSA